MGDCDCSMFCCMLFYVHSSIAIILMGKRELVALFNLSSWCLLVVERLFLPVLWGFLQFVIVVFPDHTHLLFLSLILIWTRTYLGKPVCLQNNISFGALMLASNTWLLGQEVTVQITIG